MSWQSGWTVYVLYVAFFAALGCLWPGLIRSQEAPRCRRLLWRLIAAHLAVLFFLLLCDLTLMVDTNPPYWIDHARRLVSRWAWAVIYLWMLVALWRGALTRWTWRPVALLMLLGVGLLLTGATHHPASIPETIMGNTRSHIYHWPGCPNYPRTLQGTREQTHWKTFVSRQEAEQAGYRAARNCRPVPVPPSPSG